MNPLHLLMIALLPALAGSAAAQTEEDPFATADDPFATEDDPFAALEANITGAEAELETVAPAAPVKTVPSEGPPAAATPAPADPAPAAAAPEPAGDKDAPGFGVIALVVALGVALLAMRRK